MIGSICSIIRYNYSNRKIVVGASKAVCIYFDRNAWQNTVSAWGSCRYKLGGGDTVPLQYQKGGTNLAFVQLPLLLKQRLHALHQIPSVRIAFGLGEQCGQAHEGEGELEVALNQRGIRDKLIRIGGSEEAGNGSILPGSDQSIRYWSLHADRIRLVIRLSRIRTDQSDIWSLPGHWNWSV